MVRTDPRPGTGTAIPDPAPPQLDGAVRAGTLRRKRDDSRHKLFSFLTTLTLFLVLRAFAIGRQAVSLERPFSALVAHGIGTWICVQSFINMGVNMGVLPTKGLTLPLLSYGRSSTVVTLVALGLLVRIYHEICVAEKRQLRKAKAE